MRRALLLLCLAASPRSAALEIVFTDIGPANGVSALSSQTLAGFQSAADLWESLLDDPVTVRVNVATYDFGPGMSNVIGFANSEIYWDTYASLRTAWIADASSATDDAVLGRLPAGPAYTRRINRTTDLADPAQPVLAATDIIYLNGGNAKALGLIPAHNAAADALIAFNSAFAFDYNRADGVAPGQMDFVGVAAHEIGHALGFISIVDYLDSGDPPLATAEAGHMPLDFLRYSAASFQLGVTDTSIDNLPRFLAFGNLGVAMSTGVNLGDGEQASHFVDNAGLGMMDPTASFGELRTFTGYDLMAFDAIGWDLSPEALALAASAMAAIPEPSTLALAGSALALALAARRRRGRSSGVFR